MTTGVFCIVRRLLALFLLICWVAMGVEGFRNMYVNEEFEQFEGDRLVLFWADWCPHCQKIKAKSDSDPPKQWDILENAGGVTTSKGKVPAVNYEVDEAPALVDKYDVTSFPTVMLIKADGTKIEQESGERNLKGWEDFVRQNV